MIRVDKVFKKFDARGIAGLHQVSLELSSGEILALMGPNGSGKSTLINIITGTVPSDGGTVGLDGEATLFKPELPAQDMNVQKYLISQVTLDVDDEKKIQLSRDLADIFEFTFQLRQNLSQLSMGQRQKVLLAAHLVNRPSLLLLDEPFTHLDPHTRKDILQALFTYIRQQQISLLWVTHDLDEALRFADRMAILNFGKFEQLAPPVELVRQPKNLFVAQFLGYQNFLPVKRENELWQTPWGIIKSRFDGSEALLVIPDDAWEEADDGLEMQVQAHTLLGLSPGLQVSWNERPFVVRMKRRHALPVPGSHYKLKANLSDCFLIPL